MMNKIRPILENHNLLGLTIIFGTPEAVEIQMQYGPESYLYGGLLIAVGEKLELSTHT